MIQAVEEEHKQQQEISIPINHEDINANVTDIKYPTFDSCIIDDEIKIEPTFELLFNNFKSIIDLVNLFREKFTEMIIANPFNINESFQTYHMSSVNVLIYVILIKRQIELMNYLMMLKCNGNCDAKLIQEIIEKEYTSLKNPDDIILAIFEKEDLNKIAHTQIDNFDSLKIIIEKALQDEAELINLKILPSLCGIYVTIKYLMIMIERCIASVQQLTTENEEHAMLNFFTDCTKFEIVCLLLKNCFKVPHTDLFNLKESSEEWQSIKKNYHRVMVCSQVTIRKSLNNLFKMIKLSNAAVSSGTKFESKYSKILGTGYFFGYYFFHSKDAELECKRFTVNPKFEVAQIMWNLLDTQGIKQIFVKTLPSIKHRQTLYLRKYEREINVEYIAELISRINHQSTPSDVVIFQHKGQTNVEENGDTIPYLEERPKTGQENYVKVRLLHSRSWHLARFEPSCLFSCCYSRQNMTRDALIIHIHGGGFVAMSSSSHECYLRKWTRALGVPIISIDYRLAPDNPYPKALDDVWQAYNWIIAHATDELGIDATKIILAGDSAGGNLALSLTYLLILNNKRVPNALMLSYPACRASLDHFSPSYLLTLQDTILPYHFIKFCLDSYVGSYPGENDPFLNPILIPDSILKMMPKIRILSGSSDPLRDDGIKLFHRMTQLNIDCKFWELKYFPHGFLNYENDQMIPQAKIANEIVIDEIEKIVAEK